MSIIKYPYLLSVLTLLLVAVLFLSGCIAAPAVNPIADDTLVIYQRSGGFAGLDDQLTIHTNGGATLRQHEQEHQITLMAEEINQLTTLLDNAEFQSLAGNYPAPKQGADYIAYTIWYADHQVDGVDTTIPEALYPALDLLDQLLAQSTESR